MARPGIRNVDAGRDRPCVIRVHQGNRKREGPTLRDQSSPRKSEKRCPLEQAADRPWPCQVVLATQEIRNDAGGRLLFGGEGKYKRVARGTRGNEPSERRGDPTLRDQSSPRKSGGSLRRPLIWMHVEIQEYRGERNQGSNLDRAAGCGERNHGSNLDPAQLDMWRG